MESSKKNDFFFNRVGGWVVLSLIVCLGAWILWTQYQPKSPAVSPTDCSPPGPVVSDTLSLDSMLYYFREMGVLLTKGENEAAQNLIPRLLQETRRLSAWTFYCYTLSVAGDLAKEQGQYTLALENYLLPAYKLTADSVKEAVRYPTMLQLLSPIVETQMRLGLFQKAFSQLDGFENLIIKGREVLDAIPVTDLNASSITNVRYALDFSAFTLSRQALQLAIQQEDWEKIEAYQKQTQALYAALSLQDAWLKELQAQERITLLIDSAKVFARLDQNALAADYFLRSLELLNTFDTTGISLQNQVIANTELARLAQKEGDFERAIALFRKGTDYQRILHPEEKRENVQTYLDLARCYHAMGEQDSSHVFLESAFRQQMKYGSVESPEKWKKRQFPLSLQTVDLFAFGLVEADFFGTHPLTKHHLFNLMGGVIDTLRSLDSFDQESAELELAEKIAEMMEEGITNALQLARQRPVEAQKFLQDALWFADLSKYSLLYHDIRRAQLDQFRAIPPDTLIAERIRKEEVQRLENEYFGLSEAEKASEVAEQLMCKLDKARWAWQEMKARYRKEAPAYHQLRFQSIRISPEVTQQLIAPNEAWIEYVDGQDSTFIFCVSQKGIKAFSIPALSDSLLSQFLNTLQSAPKQYTAVERYEKLALPAHHLYKLLLEPVLSDPEISRSIRHLQIVRDRRLAQLNVESLIQELPSADQPDYTNPRNWIFLGLNPDLSLNYQYAFSLAYHKTIQAGRDYERDYKGFAPWADAALISTQDTDQLLAALPYAQQGVQRNATQINWEDGGQAFSAFPERSPQDFLREASGTRIVHLPTHGLPDFEQPLNARLFFSPHEFLTAGDIYQSQLEVELLILSACHTGSGKLLIGEGLLSLDRACTFAGANSTVFSYWNVGDRSASQMVHQFLKHIRKGERRDHALQQARIELAREHPDPYFWASLVSIGRSSPIF